VGISSKSLKYHQIPKVFEPKGLNEPVEPLGLKWAQDLGFGVFEGF